MFAGASEAAIGPLKLWDLALRVVRRAAMSEEDRGLLELVRRGSETVGARLLDAASLDDLAERVQEAILSPELQQVSRHAARAMPLALLEQTAAFREASPEVVRVLGEGPAKRLVELDSLGRAAASVLFQLLATLGPDALGAVDDDPLAIVYDATIPSCVGRCILQGLRADACTLALTRAVERGERPAPWLMRALVDRLVDGQRDRLRLLASIPGVSVPFEIIPEDQRFDLRKLAGQREASEARFQRWATEAEASGQDVYFPEGDAEHA